MPKKRIWIITLFPEYFVPLMECGVAAAAIRGERGSLGFEVKVIQLRNYSPKDFKGVDDAPYGGGAGMVMRADVLKNALIEGVVKPGNYGENFRDKLHIIFPSPRGRTWDNLETKAFASTHWSEDAKDLVFFCGRYEGVDERFIEKYIDEEISVGDFVLTGGELAVLTILDSSLRFVPGVLGNESSAYQDSFEDLLLEHPQYTRPREFEGAGIPDILLSGHHANILKWQHAKKVEITKQRRPDLYKKFKEKNP